MSSGFLENYRKVSTWTPRRRRGVTSCVWPWPCPSRARRSPPAARPVRARRARAEAAAHRPPAGPPTGTCPGSQRRRPHQRAQRFNQANPNDQIQGTTFQNDAYKTRIRTAVGANQAPTIIWGWGGGTLRSYVQAGQVEDLSSWFDQNAARQEPPVLLVVRARHGEREDLRDARRDGAADHPLLEQAGVREGRRPAPAVVGRHHEPRRQVQRRGRRAVLARRPVAVDEHDVAGVPLRPHRRLGGVPGGRRRPAGRVVQPRGARRASRRCRTWSRPTASSRASRRSPPTPTPTSPCSTPTRPR